MPILQHQCSQLSFCHYICSLWFLTHARQIAITTADTKIKEIREIMEENYMQRTLSHALRQKLNDK